MEVRRAYWLSLLGAGLLFALSNFLDYLDAGRLTPWIAVSLAVAAVVSALAAYGARHPERAGGPTAPDVRFGVAVVALLLLLVVTLYRLLALLLW